MSRKHKRAGVRGGDDEVIGWWEEEERRDKRNDHLYDAEGLVNEEALKEIAQSGKAGPVVGGGKQITAPAAGGRTAATDSRGYYTGSYTGGSGYATGNYTGALTELCTHTGQRTIVKLDGVAICGAQGRELTGYEGELIVDLGGHYKPDLGTLVTGEGRTHLNSFVPERVAHVVRVQCPDYGILPVRVAFWSALWAEIKKRGYKKIVVCCVGGHGRTGTCIASLLVVVAGQTAKQAIALVRKNHCKKALDTVGQEDYVRRLAKEVQSAEALAQAAREAAAGEVK